MRERGLAVRSANGDVHIAKPKRRRRSGGARPGRRRAVRGQALGHRKGREAVRPLVAAGGVVVPFQNGVESIERIGAVVGATRVMGGVAYIAATIAEPGVIAHTGTMARLRFGPVLPEQRAAAEALLAACKGAGIRRRAVRRHPPRAVGEIRVPRGVLRNHQRVAPAARRRARRSRLARGARGGDARGVDARPRARRRRLPTISSREQMKFADTCRRK